MVARRGATTLRLIGLLLAVFLAACAAGGPFEAPTPTPEADEHSTSNANGNEVKSGTELERDPATGLAINQWRTVAPKAMILAVHGYGDYGESTFAKAAAWWTEQEINVVAYDQRGFGRNPSRGQWPGADALIADLKAVARGVRMANPCLPMVVVGHSMGGGVVMAAAPDLGASGMADGIVLAAPAIWGGQDLNPLHRILAWTVALIAPDTRISGKGVVRIQPSDNLEMLKALRRDPFYLRPPSAREILGLVRVTDRARSASQAVTLPALMLLGAKDQIVPEAAVRRVFNRIEGEPEVRTYQEGWHMLFRDLQAERVWSDVANWVLSRKPPLKCQ